MYSNRRDFLRNSILGTGLLSAGVAASFPAQGEDKKEKNNTVVGEPVSGPMIVTPEPSDELLFNPGIGLETFWSVQGDRVNYDKEVENYPKSTIAYYRFYWNELESSEGDYIFEDIDYLLKKARRRGQDIALRFMGFQFGVRYPKYLVDRVPGTWGLLEPNRWYPRDMVEAWAPDYNDPYFLERLEARLAAFGQRYNGHPDLIRLDIGDVGRWGEWHPSKMGQAVKMPTHENACRIIDMYFKYFDKTPLCMLIGPTDALRYAVSRGAGWRGDSLGDYAYHMNMYQDHAQAAGALEAWRSGPVTFEQPRDLAQLDEKVLGTGHTYDEMWETALRWGVSSFNGKSTMVTTAQVEPLDRFLRRCGYRFVLHSFSTSPRVKLSGELPVTMEFGNVGVAPPYKNYVISVRLTSESGQSIALDTDAMVTRWIPGKHTINNRLVIPQCLSPGKYGISVGVLDPYYREAEVKLAIRTPASDGWYPMGSIELTR